MLTLVQITLNSNTFNHHRKKEVIIQMTPFDLVFMISCIVL